MPSRLILLLMIVAGISAGAVESGYSTLLARDLNNRQKTNQFGIGFQAGALMGLNLQIWPDNYRAWTVTGTFPSANSGFAVDHRWYYRTAFTGDTQSLAPFVGMGILADIGNRADVFRRSRQSPESLAVSIQVPLGFEWLPTEQRYSIFGELTPNVEMTPIGTLFLTGDVGARFFF